DNGKAITNFDNVKIDSNFGNRNIDNSNPRTGIGMISPNNFVFRYINNKRAVKKKNFNNKHRSIAVIFWSILL
ncbi:hypothetical protein LJE34_09325, partial [Clostridium butyricum]|nr:hypothetical protein [Clostridium butyricum]